MEKKILVIAEFKQQGKRLSFVDDLTGLKELIKPQDFEHIDSLRNDEIANRKGIISTYAVFAERIEVKADSWRRFEECFTERLQANFTQFPDNYAMNFEVTLNNCLYSVLKGEFNKDTTTFKETCKLLKIKHTYKAIKAYIYE